MPRCFRQFRFDAVAVATLPDYRRCFDAALRFLRFFRCRHDVAA